MIVYCPRVISRISRVVVMARDARLFGEASLDDLRGCVALVEQAVAVGTKVGNLRRVGRRRRDQHLPSRGDAVAGSRRAQRRPGRSPTTGMPARAHPRPRRRPRDRLRSVVGGLARAPAAPAGDRVGDLRWRRRSIRRLTRRTGSRGTARITYLLSPGSSFRASAPRETTDLLAGPRRSLITQILKPGQPRREEIGPRDAPEHRTFRARGDTGHEERCRGAIDGVVATACHLVQRAERPRRA
jgi:hypothetical protein